MTTQILCIQIISVWKKWHSRIYLGCSQRWENFSFSVMEVFHFSNRLGPSPFSLGEDKRIIWDLHLTERLPGWLTPNLTPHTSHLTPHTSHLNTLISDHPEVKAHRGGRCEVGTCHATFFLFNKKFLSENSIEAVARVSIDKKNITQQTCCQERLWFWREYLSDYSPGL